MLCTTGSTCDRYWLGLIDCVLLVAPEFFASKGLDMQCIAGSACVLHFNRDCDRLCIAGSLCIRC
jgi:hypothetical protein